MTQIAVIASSTGSTRDGDTGLRTQLAVLDCNMAEKVAQTVLAGIGAGTISPCLLPWIPLMRGGDEPGNIKRWAELASAEPDERRRGEYGGLALVFAEAAERKEIWKEALKEWNMKVSQQVLEWQAEARAEGRVEGRAEERAEGILRWLNFRFPSSVPEDVAKSVRALRDLEKLKRLLDTAETTPSLDEFRRVLSNGGS
jgi:hypothetical protein